MRKIVFQQGWSLHCYTFKSVYQLLNHCLQNHALPIHIGDLLSVNNPVNPTEDMFLQSQCGFLLDVLEQKQISRISNEIVVDLSLENNINCIASMTGLLIE